MENNTENRTKFFAQYWLQKVAIHEIHGFSFNVDWPLFHNFDKNKIYLELKPLSEITDEEIIKCSKIFYGDHDYTEHDIQRLLCEKDEIVSVIIGESAGDETNELTKVLYMYDYLRSKGYALPFMGLSVEQLVDYGWVKLKTN